MSVDSQIVNCLPEVVTMVHRDVMVGCLGAGVAGYLTYRTVKHLYIRQRVARLRSENQEALSRQTERIQGLVQQSGHTDAELRAVSSLPWDELISQLQSGQLTATKALLAFQAASLEVTAKTNCIVTWLEDAQEAALHLDSLAPEQRRPLHGVPVSVKECYGVRNTAATAGMAKFARNIASEDSPLVRMIRSLGGVPYCKTNVPQVMYSLQCSNPLYGVTENPHSVPGHPRECGGSSGGEGALVGGGGSIIGLGSDIGGSLRSPVAFCGAWSLKPTVGRHLSQLGAVSPTGGEPVGVTVTGGFMTRSARALEAAWRTVWRLDRAEWSQGNDPSVLPPVWREEVTSKPLTIGYFTSPGLVPPASGCVRAVLEAKQRLEKAGHKVIEFPAPDIRKVMYFFNGIVLADGNKFMFENLAWDLYDSTLYGVIAATALYNCPWLLKKFLLHPLLSLLTRIPPILTLFSRTPELWRAIDQRDEFVRAYLDAMDSAGVDVLVCPGQMLPAPPTGVLGTMVAGILPYIPWNVMNFPAGIGPVTSWGEEDDRRMEADYPRDDLATRMIAGYCDPAGARGMPLGVQVVARPHHDEKVLRVLTTLEELSV